MPRIFISYRRADSQATTDRIHEYLARVFGQDNVFQDVLGINYGADFRRVLQEQVNACTVLLVIIGQHWLTVADDAGDPRLDNPDDFVRIEIETGLNNPDTLVIPVLVNNARMPAPNDLPESLRELAYRNAVEVRFNPFFKDDMARLTRQLRKTRISRVWAALVAIGIVLLAGIGLITIASNNVIPPEVGFVERMLTNTAESQRAAIVAGLATATAATWTSTIAETSVSSATTTPTEEIVATSNAQATADAQASLSIPTNTPQPSPTSTGTVTPIPLPPPTPTVSLTALTNSQEEKVLRIGHSELTDSLDPARSFSTTSAIVHKATYDTLVTFPDDSTETIIPSLATEWEISEDGTIYTFKLRDDAVFSNGDPLTADDVVFSFNRLIHINGNPSFLAESMAYVEAPDDTTVVVMLTQPDPTILARLVNTAFSVVNADKVREQGATDAEGAAESDTAESWFNSNSAGSGPYVLESWEPQVETVLVRNENYWGEAPYFDRVIVTNIPEPSTQQSAIVAGDIDIAFDLTLEQVSAMDIPSIRVFQGTANTINFLTFNRNPEVSGPVSDPRVQRAIRLALDYEGYTMLWGGVTPASIIPVGIAGAYGPDRAPQRDLDLAHRLLSDAGYPDGFDIVLHYPSWTFQGINWDTNAEKVQADLAEIGITVTLSPEEIATSLEAYRAGEQGLAMWVWGPDYLDPGDYLAFLPDQLVGRRVNWSSENADEIIIELRDLAMIEFDPQARVEIFQQIQDYMQANGPYAPFMQPGVWVGYRSDILGQVYHGQYNLDVRQLSRIG